MDTKKAQAWMIVVIIIISLFVFAALPYTPEYSIYNDNWNGTSNLREEIAQPPWNISSSRLLVSPMILESRDDIKIVIIIGSERTYSNAEKDAYESFVKRGGALIIFEDFGPARDIPIRFGVDYFTGAVKETQAFLERPSQILIRDVFAKVIFGVSIPWLIASEPAALIDFEGLRQGTTIPLLMTFPSAFIDVNDNNVIDEGDARASIGLPIALMKRNIGSNNGTLIVVGDAGLPLNQHWNREIRIDTETNGTVVTPVANSLWVTSMIYFLANFTGATNIVFDESHLSFSYLSAAGVFNLIAGTWVGWVSTLILGGLAGIFSLMFIAVKYRSRRIRRRASFQGVKQSKESSERYISRPTLTERAISEQFILFQMMGEGFIHISNSNLISQLKKTGKADQFLESLRNEYGQDFNEGNSMEELIELHNKLRNYIAEKENKWL